MPQSLFSRFDSTPISQYCNCNAITHFVILSLISGFWHSAEAQEIRFQKHVLTQEFYAEGAAASDFDGDGVGDVVAGPWIYWGPSYQEKTAIYEPKAYSVNGYSDNFFAFTDDVDGDGDRDVVFVGFPGAPGWWQRNPGAGQARKGPWERFTTIPAVDNESPIWGDLTGDGKPELVCAMNGAYGYTETGSDPTQPWAFKAVTPVKGYQRFTHGLGIGDVNGDGRSDILEKDGWWEQPADRTQIPWPFHAVAFSGPGGAQMYAVDLDGDDKNEVITSLAAHGFGLAYYKRVDDKGDQFKRYDIMTERVETSPTGLAVSQLHAIDIADINKDGVPDIITGKRWWAHNGGDAGENDPALLIWFETARTPSGMRFVPHVIDRNSGVGTEVMVHDINHDGRSDIVVGNKRGVFVHLQIEDASLVPPAARDLPVAKSTVSITDDLGGFRPSYDGKTALNFDFESGDLSDWDADGGAMIRQPANIDELVVSQPQLIAGQQGKRWIATEKFVGDKTVGELISRRFTITHPWASFLIAGGESQTTAVELREAESGTVLFSAAGKNQDVLSRIAVDLSAHQGKQVVLRIVDRKDNSWGHIAFDDFRFHSSEPNLK
jgi:hypothetical protein